MIAHQREDGTVQTVQEHLLSCACLCRAYAAKIGLQSLGELAGLLHDYSKGSPVWQAYFAESQQKNGKVKKMNHSSGGARLILEELCGGDSKIGRLTAQYLAEMICSHHGGLPDNLSPSGDDKVSKRFFPEADLCYESAKEYFYKAVSSKEELAILFQRAVTEYGALEEKLDIFPVRERDFIRGMVQKYLASCLIDADRYDTACFITGTKPAPEREAMPLWTLFSERLEQELAKFPKEGDLNALRRQISDSCCEAAQREDGINTLSSPTGSAKTLASLRYALNHARLKNKKRIFYIIPYISIIDQNAKVIKNILTNTGEDKEAMDAILELHSGMIYETEDDRELEKKELVSERMDAPLVLTTMVRFLNTFFAGGTRNIRPIHQFADSVILFDEIQNLPLKTVDLFNQMLHFLHKVCGATIVLCTATQPLLNHVPEPVVSLRLSETPELSCCDEEMFFRFSRVRVEDKRIPKGYDEAALADLVLEKAEKAGNALVVMNTIESARHLYDAINSKNSDFIVYELTTLLCPAHRKALLEEILNKLTNTPIIVVSTSLIEAGVDFDFHCVLRALAGIDSIFQAAGRCNRHGERKKEPVYIVNPAFESLRNLEDIRIGAGVTAQILDEFREQPGYFGTEFLSPRVIERFFQLYFAQQGKDKKMFYPVGNRTLSELLGGNEEAEHTYKMQQEKPFPYPLKQSFETAGEHFYVIEQHGKSVIVPYGDGKRIIAALNGKLDLSEARSLLRQAQLYTVNLSDSMFHKVEDGIVYLPDYDVYVLKDGFYDEHRGVTDVVHNQFLGIGS